MNTRITRLGIRDALRDLKRWGGRDKVQALKEIDRLAVLARYEMRNREYSKGYALGIMGPK